MPRIFTITAATESIIIDAGSPGEITFTAANSSGRPQRAIARLVPLGSTQDEWLSLGGEVERDFPIDGVHQFVAKIAPPPGTPAGRYTFRLDVVSVRNPDENFAEGPTVGFEVKPVAENGKNFPWWIIAVAAAVVVLGVLGFLLLRKTKVPDVVGKPIQEATEMLGKSSLQVTRTDRPESAVPVGQVVSQDPAAKTKVKKKSAVNLVVAAAPAQVTVPNVVRVAFATAKAQIEAAGLKAESLATVANLEFNPDEVVMQNPPAGESAAPGSTVKLLVAGASIRMPQVAGLTLSQAIQNLTQAGLVIARVTGSQSRMNEGVRSTTPLAGAPVLKGGQVSIHMPGIIVPIDRAIWEAVARPHIFVLARTPTP